ncbi:MAG: hypothetical protein ACQETI_01970 [Halobacteriota archaeon]
MIVVATDDFELYHEAVSELRDRGVSFTTVAPKDDLPERTTVLLTGNDDSVEVPANVEMVVSTAEGARKAVEDALSRMRGSGGRTVVGIDPGTRPGIAVLSGDTVVAAFHVPVADAAETVRREVEEGIDPLIRIGDGARLQGAQIINELDDLPVELVDETGTTPYLGTGARGMGDVLAAVNIAQMEGDRIEGRTIEPTSGELQVIKTRSRERSPENRAIDEILARRVASGELTLDEALDEHRAADES